MKTRGGETRDQASAKLGATIGKTFTPNGPRRPHVQFVAHHLPKFYSDYRRKNAQGDDDHEALVPKIHEGASAGKNLLDALSCSFVVVFFLYPCKVRHDHYMRLALHPTVDRGYYRAASGLCAPTHW